MSDDRVIVGGEIYVRLETVAELYHVDSAWLVEVVEADLLGEGVVTEPTLCIAAARLDRVATIVRMHVVLGLDVDAIRLALEGF